MCERENEKKYEDMIYLDHHISRSRRAMSLRDRAAQFAPFAALSGYDSAVKEAERKTYDRVLISEEDMVEIDRRLRALCDNINNHPVVDLTYFQKDEKKNGWNYITISERVKSVDVNKRELIFEGDICVLFDDIYKIDGNIFSSLYENKAMDY